MLKETQERFRAWWNQEATDRPLYRLVAPKRTYDEKKLVDLSRFVSGNEDFHINPEYRVNSVRNSLVKNDYFGDAYPYVDLIMGPGSMAAYLGCEPVFNRDTVWFRELPAAEISELAASVRFDEKNPWWVRHRENLRRAVEISAGEFPVAIPDIVENLDVVASMRGPQNLCMDLYDDPDGVKRLQRTVDDSYFRYYDALYDLTKAKDGSSAFCAFSIWGAGRTSKLQCDFSALISPAVFDAYIVPSLTKQAANLDNALYHLDGLDAVKHLDSILKIDGIQAIQWASGAGQNDGGSEEWFPMYDKILDAGKSLWLHIEDGDGSSYAEKARRIRNRYRRGIYLVFEACTANHAEEIQRVLK